MYCPNCGAQTEESAKFCPNCGAPIAASAPEPAPEPAPVFEQPAAPVAPIAPGRKRPTLFLALLFAALAVGPFLENACSVLFRLIGYGVGGYSFYDFTLLIGELLLFLSALFLIIELGACYPKGRRPVCGALAMLFLTEYGVLRLLGALTLPSRVVLRWPRNVLTVVILIVAVFCLLAAIRAFANKRFAAVGSIGAIFYLIHESIVLADYLRSYRTSASMTFDRLVWEVFYLFFGLALLLYALRFRPKK